ncbi:hypothetical protein [Colwellia echini]|uniref:Uncharacterized protein n=1 Tax=Colwellia echini TaxID=1982103 RepID=A0ABY3MXD5_9GAMM|nr:hypothetical protein [Colwellia echini]TYK65863.1 hypothetical protein CWS31_007890 [Colwellia echini]
MQKQSELENVSGFHLVHVNILGKQESVVRTSYEVVDPSGDVIGRFGSLKEAQNFINLLCDLSPEEVKANELETIASEQKNTEHLSAVSPESQTKVAQRKRRFTFKFRRK